MGHLEEFSKWPATRFIETGYGEGRTLVSASKVYPQCISIEIEITRYLDAVKRFAAVPSVRIYRGHSPEILRRILDPAVPTVFWLDAHFTRGELSPYSGNACPLLEELAIIKGLEWKTSPVILIDDWSTFCRREEGWPSLEEIERTAGAPIERFLELPGEDVFGVSIGGSHVS